MTLSGDMFPLLLTRLHFCRIVLNIKQSLLTIYANVCLEPISIELLISQEKKEKEMRSNEVIIHIYCIKDDVDASEFTYGLHP